MARGNITVPKRMEHEFRTLIACLRHAIGPEKMVLAGGTTLEMLWRHRESTDIDTVPRKAKEQGWETGPTGPR